MKVLPLAAALLLPAAAAAKGPAAMSAEASRLANAKGADRIPIEADLRRAGGRRGGAAGRSDALNDMGRTAAAHGDGEGAAALFQRAVRADPSNWAALENEGRALYALGRLEDALPALRGAVKLRPDDVGSLNFLTRDLGKLGLWEEALPLARRAVQLDPGYEGGRMLYVEGQLLLCLGRPAEALAAFGPPDARDLPPKRRLRTYALLETGRATEALAQATLLPEDFPQRSALRAQALERLGRLDEAESEARRSGVAGLYTLGLIDRDRGDLVAERADLLRAREAEVRDRAAKRRPCGPDWVARIDGLLAALGRK
jgi:tetratricopeptide (TPR) repeat protein